MALASKVTVNTTLAAAIGGIVVCILTLSIEGIWSIPSVVNGVLAGLVSITGPCAVVEVGSSVAIGLLGGIAYFAASKFLIRMKVDDPLDAWAVHGICGVWGVLSVAFFAESEDIAFGGYNDKLINATRGELFGTQLIAVLMIIVWVVFWIGLLFFTLKSIERLRVSADIEKLGLDEAEHGGSAIDFKVAKVGTLAHNRKVRRKISVRGRHLDREANYNETKRLKGGDVISPALSYGSSIDSDFDEDAKQSQHLMKKSNQGSSGLANIIAEAEEDDNDKDDNKRGAAQSKHNQL